MLRGWVARSASSHRAGEPAGGSVNAGGRAAVERLGAGGRLIEDADVEDGRTDVLGVVATLALAGDDQLIASEEVGDGAPGVGEHGEGAAQVRVRRPGAGQGGDGGPPPCA